MFYFTAAIFKYKVPLKFSSSLPFYIFPFGYRFQEHFTLFDTDHRIHQSWTTDYGYKLFGLKLASQSGNHYFLHSRLKSKEPSVFDMRFAFKESQVSLRADKKSQTLMHGNDGVVQMGDSGDSFYYSYPSMQVKGGLSIQSETYQVAGEAWFDHQWGDWCPNKALWRWFSIILDSGERLMVYQFVDEKMNTISTECSILDDEGNAHQSHHVKIDVLKEYRSETSGGVYPVVFNIQVDQDISFHICALKEEQEVRSPSVIYWEGACDVKGTFKNKAVTGKAFVETIGRYKYAAV